MRLLLPPGLALVLRRIDATSKAACAVSAAPVATAHTARMPASRTRTSVLRRPFDAIDDDDVEGGRAAFQLESELLLHRREDGDRVWHVRRWRPFELDVEPAVDSSPIEDGTPGGAGEGRNEIVNADHAGAQLAGAERHRADGAAWRGCGCRLCAGLAILAIEIVLPNPRAQCAVGARQLQQIHRKVARLSARLHPEAILQQLQQEWTGLWQRFEAFRASLDDVAFLLRPERRPEDTTGGQVVGRADQASDDEIPRDERPSGPDTDRSAGIRQVAAAD